LSGWEEGERKCRENREKEQDESRSKGLERMAVVGSQWFPGVEDAQRAEIRLGTGWESVGLLMTGWGSHGISKGVTGSARRNQIQLRNGESPKITRNFRSEVGDHSGCL
jgi:hypothetical protein